MVKLIKIYSSTSLFDEVKFNRTGISIILGKYSGDKQTTGINGIGKSTLIRLIDYCLLSEAAEAIFHTRKYKFLSEEKHKVTIEIEVNNTTYNITRSFGKSDPILFGIASNSNEQAEYTVNDLKIVLGNKFFPFKNTETYFEGNKFRSMMNFFIKDDLEHFQRSDPLNFLHPSASQKDIYIYNFFLLNLRNKNLIEYTTLSKKIEDLKKLRKSLRESIKTETGKTIEEFQTERITIEENIKHLEKSVNQYEFLDIYKDSEQKLIDLTRKINDELVSYHTLNKRLKDIQASSKISIDVDLDRMQQTYNELVPELGNLLKRNLDEIIVFRKTIVDNRLKFLIEQEGSLGELIDKQLEKVSKLEKDRSKLYRILEEKGALDSIKNTYQKLIEEKTYLQRPLQTLEHISALDKELTDLNLNASTTKKAIYEDMEQIKETIRDIKLLFIDIIKNILPAQDEIDKSYIEIEYKDSVTPVKMSFSISKSESLGKSRFEILSYDLLAFLYNVQIGRDFPRFLVHDGVLHTIEPLVKINTLNYIYHKSLEHPDFQYILTVNENEIALTDEEKSIHKDYDFNWKDLKIAEYTDSIRGMLFKRDIDKSTEDEKS